MYLLCQGHVACSVLLGMCLHQESHLGLAGDYWVLQLFQSGERSSRYRYDDLEINIFEVIKYMRAFLRKLFSVTLPWSLQTRAIKSTSVRGLFPDLFSGYQENHR